MNLTLSAKNWVRVASEAVKTIPIDQSKKYEFTSAVIHDNIRMRLLAVGAGFKTGDPYVFHEFVDGEVATFDPTLYVGHGLETIYLYTLLSWKNVPNQNSGTIKMVVGEGDGEPGVMTLNAAAEIEYNYSNEARPATVMQPYRGGTVRLPGPKVEFTSGFYHTIRAVDAQRWVNISLDFPEGHNKVQNNTVIQLTAGYAGDVLLGIMDVDNPNMGSLDMDPLKRHRFGDINLMAFIHPEIIDGEVVFQLGDPEKDGKIKLTTV